MVCVDMDKLRFMSVLYLCVCVCVCVCVCYECVCVCVCVGVCGARYYSWGPESSHSHIKETYFPNYCAFFKCQGKDKFKFG